MIQDLLFDSSDEDGEVIVLYRRRKHFRQRINFHFESSLELNERFRMSPLKLEMLCQEIGPIINHQSRKSGAMSIKQQICVTLHWLGSGSQYHIVGDTHGVSKATVFRCVTAVIKAVNETLFNTVISWPGNIGEIVNKFFNMANFPHVVGVIDGTLIPIDAPTENEESFVDRHGNHSLNCMFVCGPTAIFYYVSAKWPGSVHDARVFRNSQLCARMDRGNIFPNAVILGDSGYPLKRWLMTPLHNDPNNVAEIIYNRRLKATRQTIERALGILKEKCPCLNHLRLNPTFAGEVIKCCAILCNFVRSGEDNIIVVDEDDIVVDVDDHQEEGHLFNQPLQAARRRQQQI